MDGIEGAKNDGSEEARALGKSTACRKSMGDLQDPTDGGTLVPYRLYFVGIFPYIGPKNRPYIW